MSSSVNDNNKRGKIIFLSSVVTLLIFFLKISQQSNQTDMTHVFTNAGLVALISYVGLVWAFNFQVTLRSLVYVISQSSIIIFILSLFLEMFVFRRVGRVYELLILLSILGLMFVGTYVSMLMANIFNVAQFKDIPLVQVGRTASLILTILSIYFSTFVVLQSGLNSYVTIIILTLLIISLLITHVRHLEIQRNTLWKKIFLILVLTILSVLVQILLGTSALVASAVPAVVAYSTINIMTIENISKTQKFEYFFITLVVFTLTFFVKG